MRLWMMVARALTALGSILNFLCQSLLAAIIAAISYSVFMRYVLSRPPAWAEELSRFLFIWVVMLGAIVVTREGSHIEFTILVDRLPARLTCIIRTLNRLLMLTFCGVMVWQGARIYPIVAEAASPTFAISMGWIYVAIPVSGMLMAVYILEGLLRSLIEWQHRDMKEKSPC